MNLDSKSQSDLHNDSPEQKFNTNKSSSKESLIGFEFETLVRNTKPTRKSRIKKGNIKVPPLAKRPKVNAVKKSKNTTAIRKNISSPKIEMKRRKKLSPTISQYSGESEYENPECKTLSYFS
ncbi:hypothetical protein NPIL_451541 [Nephila pilipes]|uniref:Uncharacterized protein n=1 Tax=Nephila pilipes TaxID=299642 RepID=A0A8X6QNA1_NEPPI|nr:hypothetical protein NPIL_451541 [Nephila pilipes]